MRRGEATRLAFGIIAVGTCLFFVLFRFIFQRKGTAAGEVYYYVRYLNTYVMLAIGSCLAMFQYPLALLLNIFFLL